jgi:phosphohistidine phosphatase
VITSPYRRARETAELVALTLGAAEAEVHPDLAADGDVPLGLVREVHADGADAVLVGHQPIVEELVRVLVHPARPSIPSGFRTATIVALDHAGADRWVMHALIDPYR